ncbi:MAG TPA: hypothetical protein VFL55_01440, partial [Acetobacteraceae bacterium]|nr:hypothetical protein [Acetobacteraceae bacterium]
SGLRLSHIDPANLEPITPDQAPELVAAKFHREDGLFSAGVFEPPLDVVQREDRHAPGYLHVHGGGGEVFRNYFNLLDRTVTKRQLIWSFFSQYDPAECEAGFDAGAYEDGVASKISTLLDDQSPYLERRMVEFLYPYFRCRSWFGPESNVNNRFGYSVMPFLERSVIDVALSVPLRYKNFGDFEGLLIRRSDPELAALPSAYGHDFMSNAPLRRRVAELATYARPLWLRRHTFRIRGHFQPRRSRPTLLTDEYLRRVISPDMPRMRRYFRPPRVGSSLHLNRIATLEYLFGYLEAKLR